MALASTSQLYIYGLPTANSLLEREESLIDALLLRLHNIVELAPPPQGEVTKEAAAAQCFQMKVETQALVYLSLTNLGSYCITFVC